MSEEGNRISQEPRSSVVDAEPRHVNPVHRVDVTRKGFDHMSDKDVDRIVAESAGDTMSSKGAIKADAMLHLSEHVGFQAEPDAE